MTTETLTLADFLRERIAEDEAAIARRQAAVDETNDAFPDTPAELCDCIGIVDGAHDWNCPARALAECEAKRRVVGLHPRHDWLPEGRDECSECGCADDRSVEWPCPTLRLLALPYAEHAEYRPEWAP